MRPAQQTLGQLATGLLELLDEQQGLLERKTLELQGLAQSIVNRDEEWMAQLMGQMEQTQACQQAIDARLAMSRSMIASRLGVTPAQLNLSAVAPHLPAEQWERLSARRDRIIDTMRGLRRQHLHTSMLLIESARINRMMMESLLSRNPGLMTYGQGGSQTWRGEGSMVDAQM